MGVLSSPSRCAIGEGMYERSGVLGLYRFVSKSSSVAAAFTRRTEDLLFDCIAGLLLRCRGLACSATSPILHNAVRLQIPAMGLAGS